MPCAPRFPWTPRSHRSRRSAQGPAARQLESPLRKRLSRVGLLCLQLSSSPLFFFQTTLRRLWTNLWLLTNQFPGKGRVFLLVARGRPPARGSGGGQAISRRALLGARRSPLSGLHAAFSWPRNVSLTFQSRPAAGRDLRGLHGEQGRLFIPSLLLQPLTSAAAPGAVEHGGPSGWGRPRGRRRRPPVFLSLHRGAGAGGCH